MRLETKLTPLTSARLEVKSSDGEAVRISGYGSTFGPPADSYNDVVEPGAFALSLRDWEKRGRSMKILYNHSTMHVLGRWTAMHEDGHGLYLEGEIAPTSLGRDVATLLKFESLDGLSIGFRTVKAQHDASGVRRLAELDLIETSVVAHPANEMARITGVKSAAAEIETIRDLETLLRDELGWSRREAETVTNRVFKSVGLARDEQVPPRVVEAAVAAEMRAHSAANRRRDVEGEQASKLLALLRECRLTPA